MLVMITALTVIHSTDNSNDNNKYAYSPIFNVVQ